MWISFADTAPENLKVIERTIGPHGLSVQVSGVRWAPLVASPVWGQRKGQVQKFSYPEKPPSIPSELVRLAYDVSVGLGTGLLSAFLYDALKSWVQPDNRRRIRAKWGDLELETSEVSPDQFLQLLRGVHQVKELAELRSKLLEAGIQTTIMNQLEKPTEKSFVAKGRNRQKTSNPNKTRKS
jgi:hypothetical protein